MIDKATAEAFADNWISSWNSHDLGRILEHYDEEFVFSSPFIIKVAGEPSGILKGKDSIRAYWAKALSANPGLHFQLKDILWGINSLVILYKRNDERIAAEWFELGTDGRVIRSCAHYTS